MLEADYIKVATTELYEEYRRCLKDRKINLRTCLIQIVSSQSYWGCWNVLTRTIFISEKLILQYPWHDVIGVLRHEIAHQYVDEFLTANQQSPHGTLFKKACDRVGVPDFYVSAKVHLVQNSLDWRQTYPTRKEELFIEKMRKLLSLAQSNNEHEASLAMLRAREISARHNLELYEMNEEKFYKHLFIETKKKRLQGFEQRILSILISHFFVEVIVGYSFHLQRKRQERVIELIGLQQNVLMSEYVYFFLQKTLLKLTTHKKQMEPHRTAKDLTDFKIGLLVGFEEKLAIQADDESSQSLSQALVSFKKDLHLKNYITKIYPRLVSITSRSKLADRTLFEEGRKEGRHIQLHRPIESSAQTSIKALQTQHK